MIVYEMPIVERILGSKSGPRKGRAKHGYLREDRGEGGSAKMEEKQKKRVMILS